MACIITAPSSNSGKTLLSLILSAWSVNNHLKIQTFKVGPDYLDANLLSAVSKCTCRNLDLILCGKKWVKKSFYDYGESADLALVEGVMGLFDGIGSSQVGSTAEIAKHLNIPIVLTINARGQAASLAALIKGFINQDPSLELAGVVLNQVNSKRHKDLLNEVLDSINVKLLGVLPNNPKLNLPSKHLGLNPAHDFKELEKRTDYWSKIAEENLDVISFRNLLQAPKSTIHFIHVNSSTNNKTQTVSKQYPIAIAEDKAFHFQYPETKEYLESLGIPLINWQPTKDEPIPAEAKGLIIPGGFPEEYAEQISHSLRSLTTLKSFFGKYPIYAECGGMLLLGKSLTDLSGNSHPMSNLLPFTASKGPLKVGYRELESISNSLILKKGDKLIGHEFHHWQINRLTTQEDIQLPKTFIYPWETKGWKLKPEKEGWANDLLHASWIHLHWPTTSNVLNLWLRSLKISSKY